MRNHYLFLFVSICIIFSSCRPKEFRSDVKTVQKPWTNLNFNNNPDHFQFAIMADRTGGNRPGIFDEGVEKLNLMQPEFVLCVGDLIPGYTADTAQIKKQWKEVNKTISGLKMPFFYLPGNHDVTNKVMEQEWERMYGKRYYSFNYKNTLFVILDSNDDDEFSLTRRQTDFVLTTLKENPDVRWTFVLMHHPIWTYNTNGRFPEIEEALKGRRFTVIAGHVHHYHHAERNGANYYTLATTGAGNALRGNYFGEFDHISWVTVTKDGPVMANLRLDGILPHDISNEKTREMANPLLENVKLTNVFLCNKGEKFTNGTLSLLFENPSPSSLEIDIRFFHHHQLQIEKSVLNVVIEPDGKQLVEVPVRSAKPLDYSAIGLLFFDWEMKYTGTENKGFGLKGKYQVEVKPSQTSFVDRDIHIFRDKVAVGFENRFSNLEPRMVMNNSSDQKYTIPIEISKTTRLSFYLKNSRNETTAPESSLFEKAEFLEPAGVDDPKEGLEYKYYEGEWQSIPDFTAFEPKSTGIANNLIVSDLSRREDNWGLAFSGYFKAGNDNFYLFRVRADDACRLFINNQLVVDENTLIKGEMAGAVALKKGFYPIRIDYHEKQGNQRLRIDVKNHEDAEWKPVEAGMFFH